MDTTTIVDGDTRAFALGPIDRIPPGEGRAYRIGAAEIAVFRTRAGELYAIDARCTHRGGPLADGIVGVGRVVCPLHGRAFDLASGSPVGHDCTALRTYDVEVDEDGSIVVTIGQGSPRAG